MHARNAHALNRFRKRTEAEARLGGEIAQRTSASPASMSKCFGCAAEPAAARQLLDANTAMALNTRRNSTRLITLMDSQQRGRRSALPPSERAAVTTDEDICLDRTLYGRCLKPQRTKRRAKLSGSVERNCPPMRVAEMQGSAISSLLVLYRLNS